MAITSKRQHMDRLTLFFERIKELSFLQRLFSWRRIRSLSYDAFQELNSLEVALSENQTELENISREKGLLIERNKGFETRLQEYQFELSQKNDQIDRLSRERNQLNSEISQFELTKSERENKYTNNVAQLNQLKQSLENDRTRLNEEKRLESEEQLNKMKRQWINHEKAVQQAIKIICKRHLIDFIEEVPFKGSPDNTIKVADEYIIFDAKSPANDDLTNFPKYIKAQTEIVKKYANQENVKRDIFLVIPSNTVEVLSQQFTYNLGNYNVFIITMDSLEPIMQCLKRIEIYNFVDQLSPDERDNICRIIGRFAHTTKRRIQIDQFFANEFFEVLLKCKNDLPESILEKVTEFEKVEKLNPPTEKRAKQILINDLQDKSNSIKMEAQIREIQIPNNFNDVKNLE